MKIRLVALLKILCLLMLLSGQFVYASIEVTYGEGAYPSVYYDTPTKDFIIHKNGTVTHKKTGLMWQRCPVGYIWTGSSCSYNPAEQGVYTYWQAKKLKSNFAGKNDWRLPNIAELNTIIEFTGQNTFNGNINQEVFPISGNEVWSSSSYAGNRDLALYTNFSNGADYNDDKNNEHFVRLVRGGRLPFTSLPLTTPTSDFVLSKDGTATHKRTKLIWQRCVVGQIWTGSTCFGEAETYTQAEAKKLTSNFSGKSDWRLPTATELVSIVEYGRYEPAINLAVFPNSNVFAMGFWVFWSSTYDGDWHGKVGLFKYGGSIARSDSEKRNVVRLVRDGK